MGLGVGMLLLVLINTLRIASVVVAGWAYPKAFHILHTYLGQILMMATVLGLCLAWVNWGNWGKDKPGKLQGPVAWGRLMLLSSGLFFLWLIYHQAYVAFNDHLVETLLAWQGKIITLQRQHAVYFETFNLPFLVGLLLASRSLPGKTKVKSLVWGVLLIWTSHILFRYGNVWLMLTQEKVIFQMTNGVVLLSQYLLPFLVWFILVHRFWDSDVLEANGGTGVYRCR